MLAERVVSFAELLWLRERRAEADAPLCGLWPFERLAAVGRSGDCDGESDSDDPSGDSESAPSSSSSLFLFTTSSNTSRWPIGMASVLMCV